MADRSNTQPYWNKLWSSPRRRVEKYSMQDAVWRIREYGAKSVLDLGCGNGKLLSSLGDLDCFGIDISDLAIGKMKVMYGVEGLAMDLDDLDKFDRKFDFVVCNHTLEHIYKDRELVKNAKRLLNPGGHFYAAVPNNMSFPEETEEHVRAYNSETLSELLTEVFGNCTIKVIGHHLIGICKKEE